MQKTLIYSHTGLTSKQIGLTTEIIEGLISDDKKDIRILLCDNVLQNCYFNRTHNLLGCASCQSRQRHLLKQAGIKKEQILTLKKNEDPDQNFPFFNSTDELMAYDYKSIDIGRGVASSIISYYRDLHLNSDKYDSLIKIELSKAITVVNNIIDIYGDWSFDEIYLFNGRFSEAWPVVKFAENNSIPFYTMESGAHERYELF